jgi:hypothetical protein
MAKFLACAVLATFVVMMPIMAAPAAIAKPHSPVDCVPVGVTTKPDGSVWAIEDCNGDEIQHRMSPVKPR